MNDTGRFFLLVFLIFFGLPGLAMTIAWLLELIESSRAVHLRRVTRGARPSTAPRRRAPHPRHDPCAAWADQRRIVTRSALSTALRPPGHPDGTFPQETTERGRPGPAPGRAGQRRP